MEKIEIEIQKIKDLLEDTTGPNADNIATTDENLSVDQMFQQGALPSLGRQIFSVEPMHGPTAALFNLRKKAGTNNIELLRNEVEVYPSAMMNTGLTLEVIQDIRAQYGKGAGSIIGKLLRGLANEDENTKTLAFLDTQCKSEPALALSSAGNAETNLMEVIQKAHELVLKANSKNLRTYEAFCVLPFNSGAAIAALNRYIGGETKDERGLFLAQVGQTKFYMNPDATATTAYVGLKDSENSGKSSAVLSPYQENIIEAQDPDSGDMKYFIVNRFAITQSPLHETDNEMLFKFEITSV